MIINIKKIKSIYKRWFVRRIGMIGFIIVLLLSVRGSAIWWSKQMSSDAKSTLKCELFKWISGNAFQVQTCWFETRLKLLKPNTVRLIFHSHIWLLSCFPLLPNEKSSERVHALKIAQEKCNIAGLYQKQYTNIDSGFTEVTFSVGTLKVQYVGIGHLQKFILQIGGSISPELTAANCRCY